ncbi:MAG: hypothetical protein PHC50_00625 [Candidatus Cloacimonetes bacterium]|nr:hypothetical protein [Candidatus Cloacimonadota bacterium]
MKRIIILFIFSVLLLSVGWARHQTYLVLSGVNDDACEDLLQQNASALLSEFNRAFFKKSKLKLDGMSLSATVKQTLNEMWESKSFYCPEQQIFEILIGRSDGRCEIRNIPIIYERKSSKLLDDEVIIIFDSANNIVDFRIALEKEKYIKTFEQAQSLQDKQLLEIVMDFVENYRTAYNRKDINYIDKVFSDDALIIVGRVLEQRAALPDNMGLYKLSSNKDVSYSRQNKSQYIRNLRSCFIKNQFVRVEFADFTVQRHPVKDFVFGVQMHQKWRSSTYNDDGYLFLIIDLRDIDEPLIWVRTWQPEKDVRKAEVFELGDFIIE